MKISVIVVSLNEGYYLLNTVKQLLATLPPGSEVVVVDDGSTDGSTISLAASDKPVRVLYANGLGAPKARNWGVMNSSGDVTVFMDAHMKIQPGWWGPLVEALTNPTVGAVSPIITVMGGRPEQKGYGLRFTGYDLNVQWLRHYQAMTHYVVPLLCSCCLAMRRETFDTVGGFDEGMIRVASEDSELSVRLWLLGYELWALPHVEVAHLFRPRHPYTVKPDWLIHNKLRLAFTHFNSSRAARVVEALKEYSSFSSAFGLAVGGNVWARRDGLSAQRLHDDDWFINSFGMVL